MNPLIEGTSAGAAEYMESMQRMQIEETSAEWPMNSIFHAPAHIRSSRESNFEPKLVSIGPYYHGRENLKPMEDLKLWCVKEAMMKQLLPVRNHSTPFETGIPHSQNRYIYNVHVEPSNLGGWSLNNLPFEEFEGSGKIARAYYKQKFNHNDVDFVKMLLADSCFIIRIILSLSQQVQESMAFLDVHIKDVRSDLLLLENQIPLFFIREVYEFLFPRMPSQEFPPFNTVLEPFLCLDMPWKINHDPISSEDAAHLLDLYWKCSLSPRMYTKLSKQEQPSWAEIHFSTNAQMVIANATELHKTAGIEFEKFKEKDHLDVNFSNGIMRMPRLKIDSRQKTLLRNLVAFENCILLPSMRNISCYMKLMDALIDSEKDVKLLQKCGVIYNTLNNHEMAATFFNDIGNFCFVDNNTNHFFSLYKDVQKYYELSWHRRLASLRYNYFSSPWSVISVFAGVILLILSALQTFYTIYGYYHQNNSSPRSN